MERSYQVALFDMVSTIIRMIRVDSYVPLLIASNAQKMPGYARPNMGMMRDDC